MQGYDRPWILEGNMRSSHLFFLILVPRVTFHYDVDRRSSIRAPASRYPRNPGVDIRPWRREGRLITLTMSFCRRGDVLQSFQRARGFPRSLRCTCWFWLQFAKRTEGQAFQDFSTVCLASAKR